jgi:hypothetical protein
MKFHTTFAVLVAGLMASSFALANYTPSQSKIKSIIEAEAIRQDVPVSLAMAVARVESNFNARAISHAGARGVMQIMPRTAEQDLGVSRYALYDAETNVEAGIRFLKHLIKVYDGRVDIALSHYNGGSAVRQYGELRVIPATRKYVRDVMRWADHYAYLDEQKDVFRAPRQQMAKSSLGSRSQSHSLSRFQSRSLDDFSPGGSLYNVDREPVVSGGWLETLDDKRQDLVGKLQRLVSHNLSRNITDDQQRW